MEAMDAPAILTEHIRDLPIEAIAQLSAPELACLLDDLDTQKASDDRDLATANAEVQKRLDHVSREAGRVSELLASAGLTDVTKDPAA